MSEINMTIILSRTWMQGKGNEKRSSTCAILVLRHKSHDVQTEYPTELTCAILSHVFLSRTEKEKLALDRLQIFKYNLKITMPLNFDIGDTLYIYTESDFLMLSFSLYHLALKQPLMTNIPRKPIQKQSAIFFLQTGRTLSHYWSSPSH